MHRSGIGLLARVGHEVARLGMLAYACTGAWAFEFAADSFQVTRNGSALFADNFDGSTTPPAAPNFANGTTASYVLHGSFQTPTGGRLWFTSQYADVSSSNPNFVTNRLRLKTDTDPTNLSQGLKPGASFDAIGVFDLALPANTQEAYLVELGDSNNGIQGRELVRLGVFTDTSGNAMIRFWSQDNGSSPPTATDIGSAALDASHQQIRLHLAKPDAASNAVNAYYSYVDNGIAGPESAVNGSATVFTYNGFTRASLVAFTPIASGTSNGGNSDLSITADVHIGGAYVGTTGNVYLAAIDGSSLFFNDGKTWAAWKGGPFPVFEPGVVLKDHTITILSHGNVTALAGTNTSVVVGYGTSDSDMLANSAYSIVYIVK